VNFPLPNNAFKAFFTKEWVGCKDAGVIGTESNPTPLKVGVGSTIHPSNESKHLRKVQSILGPLAPRFSLKPTFNASREGISASQEAISNENTYRNTPIVVLSQSHGTQRQSYQKRKSSPPIDHTTAQVVAPFEGTQRHSGRVGGSSQTHPKEAPCS
jgi:hypothetical protein